jgi:hypothetical protein
MARTGGLALAFSLGLLAAAPDPSSIAAEQDCVVVENFAGAKPGELPAGWKLRKDAGREVYAVTEEDGRRFLRASSRGLGVQAAKQHEWDPNEYPVLRWTWRPRTFPNGGDERQSKTNDSALAVYAVWPHSSVAVKSVKYVWSASVQPGTELESSRGLTQVRVLRNGKTGERGWVEERVNVADDYRRLFRDQTVPKAAGIAVLTDADDTNSVAEGDYADFRLCRG